MKVNRKQFDKAMKDLPKLKKAEAVVGLWKEGMKEVPADRELLEVEREDLGFIVVKTCGKEKRAPA